MSTPRSASLTQITATINRPSLWLMAESFLRQELLPEDRLIILGDGCTEPEWLQKHSQIVYIPCEKKGRFGHDHLHVTLNSGLIGTDYVFLMGDDDAWLPEGLTLARRALGGEVMWYVPFLNEAGAPTPYVFHAPAPAPLPWNQMPVRAAGLRPFIPNKKPFEWKYRDADGTFYAEQSERFLLGFWPRPVMLAWAPAASQQTWEELGMNQITPWQEWDYVKRDGGIGR